MTADESHLRAFYDVMVECGLTPPPWEVWSVHARQNAELWPIAKGGRIVGGIFFKGHTIHVAVLPEWQGRWVTKAMLRAWREHYTHDCDLYATPLKNNRAACELAKRLGFKFHGPQGQSNIYVKERTPCPQQSSPQS